MMAAVRGKDTAPELAVRKAAHRLGLRFRLQARGLPGRPDLVLPKWKTAVFVNGCFWHRHGCKRTTVPKSNSTFWLQKFGENTKRDAANYAVLADMGWKVVVIWQCEIGSVEHAIALIRQHFPAFIDRDRVRQV